MDISQPKEQREVIDKKKVLPISRVLVLRQSKDNPEEYECLFLRNKRLDTFHRKHNSLELPGGKVCDSKEEYDRFSDQCSHTSDFRSTSYREAAIKELKEETGIIRGSDKNSGLQYLSTKYLPLKGSYKYSSENTDEKVEIDATHFEIKTYVTIVGKDDESFMSLNQTKKEDGTPEDFHDEKPYWLPLTQKMYTQLVSKEGISFNGEHGLKLDKNSQVCREQSECFRKRIYSLLREGKSLQNLRGGPTSITLLDMLKRGQHSHEVRISESISTPSAFNVETIVDKLGQVKEFSKESFDLFLNYLKIKKQDISSIENTISFLKNHFQIRIPDRVQNAIDEKKLYSFEEFSHLSEGEKFLMGLIYTLIMCYQDMETNGYLKDPKENQKHFLNSFLEGSEKKELNNPTLSIYSFSLEGKEYTFSLKGKEKDIQRLFLKAFMKAGKSLEINDLYRLRCFLLSVDDVPLDKMSKDTKNDAMKKFQEYIIQKFLNTKGFSCFRSKKMPQREEARILGKKAQVGSYEYSEDKKDCILPCEIQIVTNDGHKKNEGEEFNHFMYELNPLRNIVSRFPELSPFMKVPFTKENLQKTRKLIQLSQGISSQGFDNLLEDLAKKEFIGSDGIVYDVSQVFRLRHYADKKPLVEDLYTYLNERGNVSFSPLQWNNIIDNPHVYINSDTGNLKQLKNGNIHGPSVKEWKNILEMFTNKISGEGKEILNRIEDVVSKIQG